MFLCKDLLSLPTLSKAKLVAGENGLSNGIRWSYKAESMDFANWIHGQELLIVSSPVIQSKDFDLYQLVKEAIRHELSGILLLVGEEYIKSVSKKVIKISDENKIPIICLPGAIPLVDILEELGHAIAYKDKAMENYEDLLADIIFGTRIDTRALSIKAKLLGYNTDKPQRIFMAHFTIPDEIRQQGIMDKIQAILEEIFKENESQVIISCFNYNLIGLTGETSKEKLQEIFDSFCKRIKQFEKEICCKIGVGSSCPDCKNLRESFEQASKCIEMASPVKWYEELGFMKLLMSMEDHKLLEEYLKQTLGKILEYDLKNKTQFIKTLEAYFYCNENMKDTAKYIFSHPNTIKYRLQRIEEISGYSMESSADKLELQVALNIMHVCDIRV